MSLTYTALGQFNDLTLAIAADHFTSEALSQFNHLNLEGRIWQSQSEQVKYTVYCIYMHTKIPTKG